jgi:hypothetical protein
VNDFPSGTYEAGFSYSVFGRKLTGEQYGLAAFVGIRYGAAVFETINRHGEVTQWGLHFQFSPGRIGYEEGGNVGVTYSPGSGEPHRELEGSGSFSAAYGAVGYEHDVGGPNASIQFGFGERVGGSAGLKFDVYVPFERNDESLRSIGVNLQAGTVTAAYGKIGTRILTHLTVCFDPSKCSAH